MAQRTQTTFYPSTAPACLNIAASPFCKNCNTDQSRNCCTSSAGDNMATNYHTCDAICNSCQNDCNTVQNYCGADLNMQLIIDHADTGQYPTYCMVKDEFIFRNWTAERWNEIISNLQTAYALGRLQNHGTAPAMTDAAPDPKNETHIPNSLVTAEKYNQVAAAINGFVGTSLPTVAVGDVIRGTHAQLQKEHYEKAKFNTTVCDICNTSAQFTECPCTCDCDCACDCSCGCSCDCNCNCSCTCTCSCATS